MGCHFGFVRPDAAAVRRLPSLRFPGARGLPLPGGLETPSLASAVQSQLSYGLTNVDPAKENRGATGLRNPNRRGGAQGASAAARSISRRNFNKDPSFGFLTQTLL